jgi:hypothetical protein
MTNEELKEEEFWTKVKSLKHFLKSMQIRSLLSESDTGPCNQRRNRMDAILADLQEIEQFLINGDIPNALETLRCLMGNLEGVMDIADTETARYLTDGSLERDQEFFRKAREANKRKNNE